MPAVDDLFKRSGLRAGDLDGVVADVGPGLFTGLRVGLATAKAIVMAGGLLAAGVTSLEVLAHAQRRRAGLVASMVDARRGEVFWALYRSDGSQLQQLSAAAASEPGEAAVELASLAEVRGEAPILAVGDGAWRYRSVLEAQGPIQVGSAADLWASPLVLAELGAPRLVKHDAANDGGPFVPMYLRQADVRIGWEEVGGRVGQ